MEFNTTYLQLNVCILIILFKTGYENFARKFADTVYLTYAK